MVWIKAVNSLSADLWAWQWYVGQDDSSEKPLIHETSMKRHSEPGHVENRSHGVKTTISYKPSDNYE